MDMDLGMDIAGYSVANASANVQQSVSVAMLSKTLEAKTKKKFNLRETVTMLPRLL